MKRDLLAERIGQSIAQATGIGFAPLSRAPVSDGCIHAAFRLDGRAGAVARSYFVKVNEARKAPLFAAEAEGLAALARVGALRVPGVVAQGVERDHAWLVLEWLELAMLDPSAAAGLGIALATQHRAPQARYGWERDNFIGGSSQPNGWSDDWLEFWRHRRLAHQLRLAAHNRLPSKLIDQGERLAADCDAFFRNYEVARSLLHGDLWGGNAAQVAGAGAVVFDPAVYVGDREADMAMTELFGGFPADFRAAYREAWPLADGYRVRRDLYNLYHVLNHANLFAGDYVRKAVQAVERLLAELG
ncbi:MAG TPA: fructosamine kinase family protein [Usitatibacter sp.]|nr:fructosamine kinase family protein [Usitatibacter sp.]